MIYGTTIDDTNLQARLGSLSPRKKAQLTTGEDS